MNSYRNKRFVCVAVDCIYIVGMLGGCNQSEHSQAQRTNSQAVIERQYDVSDIIRSYDSEKSIPERVDEWVVCITANIESAAWHQGMFSISADHENESISAKCDTATHERIYELLEDIRKMNAAIR